MKHKEILKVNETFQYSINLQFDINNITKIQEYIPTKDSCEVMSYYIDSTLGNYSKATILVGPYGKGKSHLLLVLLTILNDYHKEDEAAINELLEKIKKLDNELYEKISHIRKEKRKYMPVIINSNYNNLNQAFLLAITEALEREELTDMIVDTHFDIALKVIEKWEQKEYQDVMEKFNSCLKDSSTTLKKLKSLLKMYDEKGYEIFKTVYSCVMHGMEFNPFINTDIIKYYKDINYKINQKGYQGMLIIFDEFSKFLEYVGNENITRDLKLIQDFAELSTRTGKNEQILLSCITHKAINQYIKNIRENKENAFRTVEGRFKEIHFNRSMQQNYEMISQTIIKKEKADKAIQKYIDKNADFYQEIEQSYDFARENNISNVLFKGCFPLNPITVYALINLSERIAQNERTLFTFLTDNDRESLKTFISGESEELFNIDKVYDYFSSLLRKENDETIKMIWLKAENALNKTKEEQEQKIIKAISILYMLNETHILAPNDKTIRLALKMKQQDYLRTINNLIDYGILKRKKTTQYYDFTTIYNKEILKQIDELINEKFREINQKETLEKILGKQYVIPRQYNQEYKMTRFFRTMFITENELLQLKSFNILFKDKITDGIILNLIKTKNDTSQIEENFLKISDDRVVLRIPKEKISEELLRTLKEYEAIQYIKKMESSEEDVQREIELIQQEIIEFTQNEINKKYQEDAIKQTCYLKERYSRINNIGELISKICKNIYPYTPIINNEMINKSEITPPIYKARNIVIDTILKNDITLLRTATSPEATIYKATVGKKDHETMQRIVQVIKNYIQNSDQKNSFEPLYNELQNKPYGVRKEVLPILTALAMEEYKDSIILYYENRELDIDSNTISKILEVPQHYYIKIEQGTIQKMDFVLNMMKIFEIEDTKSYRNNIKELMLKMRKWVLSLPRIVRDILCTNTIITNFYFIDFKNELLKADINNNEFLFNKTKEIFHTEDDREILKNVLELKELLDNYVEKYSNKIIADFKECFEHNSKSNLNVLLSNWYKGITIEVKHSIVRLEIKQLFDYINHLKTYNDEEIIQEISHILLGIYMQDWQDRTYQEFFDKVNEILEEVKQLKIIDKKEQEMIMISDGKTQIKKYISSIQVSNLGTTLKNNIEDAIEEYGESISENEKVLVLLEIIKKYI